MLRKRKIWVYIILILGSIIGLIAYFPIASLIALGISLILIFYIIVLVIKTLLEGWFDDHGYN